MDVDLIVFVIANLVNLIMIAIFLARVAAHGRGRVERILGLILIGLGVPVVAVIGLNAAGGRTWWLSVLPMPLVAFLLLDLVLDYILKADFRRSAVLGPYLALYYLALLGMTGYAFAVGKVYGMATLVTYFLNLGATWYSYSRTGHGGPRVEPGRSG